MSAAKKCGIYPQHNGKFSIGEVSAYLCFRHITQESTKEEELSCGKLRNGVEVIKADEKSPLVPKQENVHA